MSIFSQLFGGRQSAIERELHDLYVQILCTFVGFPPADAERAVSEAIVMCKQQGAAQDTADWPEDFGDDAIKAAREGEPAAQRFVNKARREGASDDDFKEWWNLPDLSRRMVMWSEDVIRHSVFCHAIEDDGLSHEDAAARVHAMFPTYGDFDGTCVPSGDNRPLPHELRARVDSYKQVHGAEHIADRVKDFSSYNAFVRHAIETGSI